MNYYELFNLGGEPFSNSPDPDFFFRAKSHAECLNSVEIALRLRRGLNVVLGDVGVGKSTICRELIRNLAADPAIRTHLLLDPYFASASEFLRVLHSMLCSAEPEPGATDWQMKEAIKVALLERGAPEHGTGRGPDHGPTHGGTGQLTVVILDEGQKIRSDCLELLREFLNYETNSEKLLQIVIFAQTEFQDTLRGMPNLADRVNLAVRLSPMGLRETVAMIRFRLDRVRTGYASRDLFTWPAYWAIHQATGGYPRKIITLCHRALLALIVQNGTRVTFGLIRGIGEIGGLDGGNAAGRSGLRARRGPASALRPAAVLFLVLLALLVLLPGSRLEQVALQLGRTLDVYGLTSPSSPTGPTGPSSSVGLTAPEAGSTDGSAGLLRAPALDATKGSALAGNPAGPAEPRITERPSLLGRLTLLPQERVSDLLVLVYGSNAHTYLQLLAQANPQIQNLDRVPVGTELTFPALQVPPDHSPAGLFWLRLAPGQDSLGPAIDQVRTLRKGGTKARLLVHWSPDDGLRYEIVAATPYGSREAAVQGGTTQPAEIAAKAAIIGGWDQERVFFSATKPAKPGRSS